MTPNKVKVRVHREGEVKVLVAALSRFLGLNEKRKRSKAAYVCQNPQVCCNLSPMGSSSIASRSNNWQSIGVTGVPSVSVISWQASWGLAGLGRPYLEIYQPAAAKKVG